MLRDVVWKKVMGSWREEAGSRRRRIIASRSKEVNGERMQAVCVEVKCKRRRILVKLRGGTASLKVYMGRWKVWAEKRGCARVRAETYRMWSTWWWDVLIIICLFTCQCCMGFCTLVCSCKWYTNQYIIIQEMGFCRAIRCSIGTSCNWMFQPRRLSSTVEL